jgi:hypothetical protein
MATGVNPEAGGHRHTLVHLGFKLFMHPRFSKLWLRPHLLFKPRCGYAEAEST